jgi:hypothetical protein
LHWDKAHDILRRLEALTPKERVHWAVETSRQFKKKVAEFLSAREQQKRTPRSPATNEQQLVRLDRDLDTRTVNDGSSKGSNPADPAGVAPFQLNEQERKSGKER